MYMGGVAAHMNQLGLKLKGINGEKDFVSNTMGNGQDTDLRQLQESWWGNLSTKSRCHCFLTFVGSTHGTPANMVMWLCREGL